MEKFDFTLHSDLNADQIRESQVQAELNKPSLSEGAASAWRRETLLDTTIRTLAENSAFKPDPDYSTSPEELKELTKDIPQEYWKSFSRAMSPSHANWIRESILQEMDDDNTLTQLGGWGVGLRMGAAILDPTQWLVAAALGPAAAIDKATRASKFFTGGLAAASGNMGIEALLQEYQHTRDPWDILNAGLIGFALGGSLSALTKGENAALKHAASTGAHETTLRGLQAIDPDIKLLPPAQKLLSLPSPKPEQLDAEFVRGIKADFSKQVDDALLEMFPPSPKDLRPFKLSDGPDPDPIRLGDGSIRLPDRSRDFGPLETAEIIFRKVTMDRPREPSEFEIGVIKAKLKQLSNAAAAPAKIPSTLEAMVRSVDEVPTPPTSGVIEPNASTLAPEALPSAADDIKLGEPQVAPDRATPEALEAPYGQFKQGDTVFYRDGRASGVVLKVLPNGKVSIRDDLTGATKVVRPDDADPFLSPGLLDDTPGSGITKSPDDPDEFVICVR